ncbi:MAG: 4a-hydroxytetrahydrobiopterin dehydratase [Vicinamibacterales bacterium]
MAKLTEAQIVTELETVQGWILNGKEIRRQFVFDGFASAVAFVVRVGFDAEGADHHPDILISNYKKVTLTFSTHSEGGVTAKDFTAALAANRVYAA